MTTGTYRALFFSALVVVGCTATPAQPPATSVSPLASPSTVSTLAAGMVTTLTGSYPHPSNIDVDAVGNVYLHVNPEGENDQVYKLAPDGAQSVAWMAPYGHQIQDLTTDPMGTLYVSTFNNQFPPMYSAVFKVMPDGTATELAEKGETGGRRIAADGNGHVYVADTYKNRIKKIAATGEVTILAGTGNPGELNGDGAQATFNSPRGLTVDSSGNVYVADTQNRKIRKISSDGQVSTLASLDVGPHDMGIDREGNLYTATDSANTILRISSSGAVTPWAGDGTLCQVHAIALHFRVATHAGDPDPCTIANDGPRLAARLLFPQSLGVQPDGVIYLAESLGRLRRITP